MSAGRRPAGCPRPRPRGSRGGHRRPGDAGRGRQGEVRRRAGGGAGRLQRQLHRRRLRRRHRFRQVQPVQRRHRHRPRRRGGASSHHLEGDGRQLGRPPAPRAARLARDHQAPPRAVGAQRVLRPAADRPARPRLDRADAPAHRRPARAARRRPDLGGRPPEVRRRRPARRLPQAARAVRRGDAGGAEPGRPAAPGGTRPVPQRPAPAAGLRRPARHPDHVHLRPARHRRPRAAGGAVPDRRQQAGDGPPAVRGRGRLCRGAGRRPGRQAAAVRQRHGPPQRDPRARARPPACPSSSTVCAARGVVAAPWPPAGRSSPGSRGCVPTR